MKKQKTVRLIAIILVVLMVGSVVFSALVSAIAEEAAVSVNDQYTIEMEYLSDEQALRVSQRLVYVNRSDSAIDRVVFYAMGNMFRRESALMYESEDLEAVFYAGFAPGGLDIQSVYFNGEVADWGFQGENEMYLRVSCDLAPGESGVFEFEYYLLLMQNAAFLGVGETDVRLSAFYFIPGVYNQEYDEYNLKAPLPFTRWLYAGAADYDVTLVIPDTCLPASTGEEVLIKTENHQSTWHIEADDVCEFAVSFGKRYRLSEQATDSGVQVRVLSNDRSGDDRALQCALATIEQCEAWFGAFPLSELDIVQTDYPLGALNYPGMVWLSNDLMKAGNAEQMQKHIRFSIAQQYFGLAARTEPSADAWLSDSICEYISYLMLEDAEGHDQFLRAINKEWVDSLQITIPGGLRITSEAALFTGDEYELIVLSRGAVVLHELRTAMGLESLLDGLAEFYRMGLSTDVLGEMDLVKALDTVSSKSWEAFLTDWLFNIGDYVDQNIDWFE